MYWYVNTVRMWAVHLLDMHTTFEFNYSSNYITASRWLQDLAKGGCTTESNLHAYVYAQLCVQVCLCVCGDRDTNLCGFAQYCIMW